MTTLDGQVIALDANTGKEVWKVRKRRSRRKGETKTMAGLVVKDKYIVGVSGGEFGIRGWVAAYALADGKQMWKAYSMGPDEDIKLAPDFNAANPHYGRCEHGHQDLAGRALEERRRHHVGLVLVRPRPEPRSTTPPATRAPGIPRRARATTSGR